MRGKPRPFAPWAALVIAFVILIACSAASFAEGIYPLGIVFLLVAILVLFSPYIVEKR